ncbi:MAG: T9SS type A sorting domain-containing protein [Bacteroidales bacterium]|nr:T9SS type A sorting domain-containing protein [Bacteroidales bacterium]
MKHIFTLTLLLLFTATVNSQQFIWAESYDISNTNEVAAMTVDADSNVYITGIHNAPSTLPYKGDAYILKTTSVGEVLRTDYIFGQLLIGDMIAVGTDVLIVGQSTNAFVYRGSSYEDGQYFMFMMMIDASGNHLWHITDQSKWGAYASISLGNTGNIAVHVRNQSNLGDWILILDPDGNILKSKQVSSAFTLVKDIAFYNDKIYFNGGFNGPGTVMVDTILIELPQTQNASITMGLNEDLTAEWLFMDETFNNATGRIVANENGLYVYEQVVEGGFTPENTLKKLSFDGQLMVEVIVPFFTHLASFRADMVSTPTYIGLFTQNASDFNSHKVVLFNHDLALESEKIINGPSVYYSGQISSIGDEIFVSHVHKGDLVFVDDLTLPYNGTGNKAYISNLSFSSVATYVENPFQDIGFMVFPNPSNQWISVNYDGNLYSLQSIKIFDQAGSVVLNNKFSKQFNNIDVRNLPRGVYYLHAVFSDKKSHAEKSVSRKIILAD